MSKPKSHTTKSFPEWLEACRWHWDKGTELHRTFRPSMTALFTMWANTHDPIHSALRIVKAYQNFLLTCEFNQRPPSDFTFYEDPNTIIPLCRAALRNWILLPTDELLATESLIPGPYEIKAAAQVWLEGDFPSYNRFQPLITATELCPHTNKSLTCIEYFTFE